MALSENPIGAALAAFFVILGVQAQTTAVQIVPSTCTTVDQLNPISKQYPSNVTGLLNVTMAIIPIPLTTARQIILPQYGILENAYKSLIPNFSPSMYPVLVQAVYDHDIQFRDFKFPDFSRAGFEFPFLDLLGDAVSPFRWAPEQIISATNLAVINGSQAATYFNGSAGAEFMSLEIKRTCESQTFPYSFAMFDSVVNQPIFANGSTCDQQICLFNTTVTKRAFEPIPVRVSIKSNLGLLKTDISFSDVAGFQAATAFIENNYLPCEIFRE